MMIARGILPFILYKATCGLALLATSIQQQVPFLMSSTGCKLRCPRRSDHPKSTVPALLQSAKSFDFASPVEWENYYRHQEKILNEDEYDEWHSSIPLKTIASMIPNDADCLCVGCGTSRLPSAIFHQRRNRKREPGITKESRIVLLDSSPSCISRLEDIYGLSAEYVCGDATRLSFYFCRPETSKDYSFDIIVDKGLTDAILCSEGFDRPLGQLMLESAKVLKSGGRYLLISYKLPRCTRDFIREVGRDVDLDWEFDVDIASAIPKGSSATGSQTNHKGSQRVSVSWATKVSS